MSGRPATTWPPVAGRPTLQRALQHYLSHTRRVEELSHQDHPAHAADPKAARREAERDAFAAEHPLTASWVRWGEEPHR